MDNTTIIKQCQDFLEESNNYYGKEISRQENALASIDDIFSSDIIKEFKRNKRKNLQYSKLPVIIDALASGYNNSPYHIEIDDEQFKECQPGVDSFENMLETKLVSRKGFKRGVGCGAGYIVVGIEDGENDNDKPFLEFIQNQSSVAVDPNAVKPSLEDAEEGATIQFIAKRKAQRMYPEADLSKNSGINWTHLTRWANTENTVQLVSYYYKDENGSVHLAKICGNYVQDIDLRIHIIPIIRYAGYQQYKRGSHIEHIGIADRLKDIILAEAIAFSSMVERSNRTMKSKVAMSDKALQGDAVINGIKKCEDDESMVLPYHMEGGAPIPLTEHFQTDDLTAIIERSRVLEQDTSGILLQGLQPTEKTATETKFQQLNQINNNDELYLNAEFAQRHLAKVILEIICGTIPSFVLKGGVGNIETSLENERLIADCQNLLSGGNVQLAYLACKNSKASIKDDIMACIKASNPDVIFPMDEQDVYQQLAQAKQIAEEAIMEAQNQVQAAAETVEENRQLNLQLLDSKAAQMEQAREFNVNTQLKIMEMQSKAGIEDQKLAADIQKDADNMVVEQEKIKIEKAKVIADAMEKQPEPIVEPME